MNQTQGIGANPEPTVPPPTTPPTTSIPSKKKVVALKADGSRWAVKFDGHVTRRDIAHLTRLIRLEFIRSKRKGQLERRKAQRAKETKE